MELSDAEIPRLEMGAAKEDYQVHMVFQCYMHMNQYSSSPMRVNKAIGKQTGHR
jgi:hypothetical protein